MRHVFLFKDTRGFRHGSTIFAEIIDTLWANLTLAIGLHATRTEQRYPQWILKIGGFFSIIKNDKTLLAMFCCLIALAVAFIYMVRAIALYFLS